MNNILVRNVAILKGQCHQKRLAQKFILEVFTRQPETNPKFIRTSDAVLLLLCPLKKRGDGPNDRVPGSLVVPRQETLEKTYWQGARCLFFSPGCPLILPDYPASVDFLFNFTVCEHT